MTHLFPDYPKNWENIKHQVFERDGWRCRNCGTSTKELHVHHIKPLSSGGSNEADNLISLCRYCHQAEHPHMNAEIRGLTKSNIHQIRQKNECTKCGRIYPFKKGLTFCPACGFYLKTITKQVTNPPKGKYDYHFLKYGVEDDPENEYQIDEE